MKLTYQNHDGTTHEIEAQAGKTVMEVARENNLPGIVAECGGSRACATCHVYVADDWLDRLPEKEEMESDMLEFAWEPEKTSRLSCQIRLTEDLDGLFIRIPEQQA